MKTIFRIACLFAAFGYGLLFAWMLYAAGASALTWYWTHDPGVAVSGAVSFCCAIACAITAGFLLVGSGE